MKIILNKEEAIEIIFNSLCNGLAYIQGYGLSVNITNADYDKAKQEVMVLLDDSSVCICVEDILIHHLKKGRRLPFWDDEGEEESSFDLEQAIKNLQNEDATHWIMQFKNEEDDAVTADCILQFCLYGEIIFG